MNLSDIQPTKILLPDMKWYAVTSKSFRLEEFKIGYGIQDIVVVFKCLDETFVISVDDVKGYIYGS